MIVTEVDAPLILPPTDVPRSVGIHQSALIRCIATETGILKPEWAEELSLVDVRSITDRTAIIRISIGLAWEAYYLPQVEGILKHPPEIQLDGIYMTYDGESVDVITTERNELRHVLMLHECKATYKSINTVGDLRNQWMWLAQIKAYCKGIGTRFAHIHILFICGDYKFPITPQLKRWQLEFTQQEIDDNWQLLTDYRDHRLAVEAEARGDNR